MCKHTTGAANLDKLLCSFLVAVIHLNKMPEVEVLLIFWDFCQCSQETVLFKLHVPLIC